MNSIARVVSTAVTNAARRTSRQDAAAGIISVLRLVRSVLNEQAGYARAAALDDVIRGVLLVERRPSIGGQEQRPVPLPKPSASRDRRIAAALLEEVAAFCLGLHNVMPAGTLLDRAIECLVGQLIAQLGGIPETDELLAAIKGPAADADASDEEPGLTVVLLN